MWKRVKGLSEDDYKEGKEENYEWRKGRQR